MGILTNIAGIIVASSMLYTAYPQNLCISRVINSQSEIKLVEKSIDKNSDYLKEDIKIPRFIGGNDKKKVNIINNTINDDILPKINDAEKTAKEYFGKIGQEKPTFPYEIFSRYTVSEDNNKVISLFNDYYEYLGGAHGMTIRSSYTIDKSTENLLFLKDLFAPGYNYMEIINKEIKREINENPQNYFDSGNVFKGIKENQNFYVQDGELVIYYQLYELAPYVFGFPEFKIPLKVFDSNYIYT